MKTLPHMSDEEKQPAFSFSANPGWSPAPWYLDPHHTGYTSYRTHGFVLPSFISPVFLALRRPRRRIWSVSELHRPCNRNRMGSRSRPSRGMR
ncbi:hypothetical protein I7I50_05683 [Histoplasma capsulatum G186AR]|uniref:Uncharacterized protein n=1 Tax=Ajellomyces capsulatus TaxID=5037 RepID=A0A8H8D8B2_AJECA|nr:hypothetical protein I7I52_03943 [Histoplasma capsulatum]QSS76287.1 hypothetical protein I7I50_05683 [Histoplasma capsulatum G186AR]